MEAGTSMKSICLIALVLWGSGALLAQEEVPVVPTDYGNAVKKLLYARPFQLESEAVYGWTKERSRYSEGLILVLEVDRDYAQQRNAFMPVLYVGTRPAEVTNHGHESGRMVVIVPGKPNLETTPIYFGSVQLPERVTSARGTQELEAARALGIRPASRAAVRAASETGGEKLTVKDRTALYAAIADVILAYSPGEVERANTYKMKPLPQKGQ